jgi:hypothetical protein
MSWPEAERCASSLERAGGRALDYEQAVEVLKGQIPPSRVDGAAYDLRSAGLVQPSSPASRPRGPREGTKARIDGELTTYEGGRWLPMVSEEKTHD